MEIEFAFDCEAAVIIKKVNVEVDWEVLKKVFDRPRFLRFGLRIFCANLAAGICNSKLEAENLICLGSSLNSQDFIFQLWDFRMVEEERKQVFKGGWVMALDVPPFLRTKEFIASMAEWCGGLIDKELDCWRLNWLEEVCFKAKGNVDGFIPMGCYVNHSEFAFLLRFYVGWKREEDNQKWSESPSIKVVSWSFGLSCGQKEKETGGHVINLGKRERGRVEEHDGQEDGLVRSSSQMPDLGTKATAEAKKWAILERFFF